MAWNESIRVSKELGLERQQRLASQALTSESLLHQLDLRMRKHIHHLLGVSKPLNQQSLQECAHSLNILRRKYADLARQHLETVDIIEYQFQEECIDACYIKQP